MIRTAETHPLTWRLRVDQQPVWFDEYRAKQGYVGAEKALAMAPTAVTDQVKAAGLRGRGGAGFPTGVKWSLVPMDPQFDKKYILCNADEMEPGTYKDRLLMEQLPHQLIEGMLIGAYALKAYRGYIFLRGEYIEAAQRLRQAIEEATKAGFLGKNILGTGFFNGLTQTLCSFDIFATQEDITTIGFQCISTNQHAFDQLMGQLFHQQTIFVSTRLHFVGITKIVC